MFPRLVSGDVYHPWTAGYEKRREVHSPGCCERPSLIVVPENIKVKFLSVFVINNHFHLSKNSSSHGAYITSVLYHQSGLA